MSTTRGKSPVHQVESDSPIAPITAYVFIAAAPTNMICEMRDQWNRTLAVATVSVLATATSLMELLKTASYTLTSDCSGIICKPAGDVFYNTGAKISQQGVPTLEGDPAKQGIDVAPTTSSICKFASGAVGIVGRARV